MLFRDYIQDICRFYREQGMRIDPIPKLKLYDTEVDKFDPFIQTGNYNPSENTITLFTGNRHVKDILRTYCHELVHRSQHLEDSGRFSDIDKTGTLQENKILEDIEGDAYKRGNILFRKWTESHKTENAQKRR